MKAKTGVEVVLDYAYERYETGWDVVVESYEKREIRALVEKRGVEGALAHLAEEVGLWYQAKADVLGLVDPDDDADADDAGDDDLRADARDSWWDDASYIAYQTRP